MQASYKKVPHMTQLKREIKNMASNIRAVTKTEKGSPTIQKEELAYRLSGRGLRPKKGDESKQVFYSFRQQTEETYRTKK